MKADARCPPCLKRLAFLSAELATSDPELRSRAAEGAIKILEQNFSTDVVPASIADEMHAKIKELTNTPDPYAGWKRREMEISKKLSEELKHNLGDDLRSWVEFAAIGNIPDWSRSFESMLGEMRKRLQFAIDDIDGLENELNRAQRVLYLADNAGECYFDLPLIEGLRGYAEVAYVVKGAPIQNDITLEDLQASGVQFEHVITTGAAKVGINLQKVSAEFRRELEKADVLIAKGMGNYETLSELPERGRVFYLLIAKCAPVAESLGVPEGKFIAMLR